MSIIIPTRNRKAILWRCLHALREQTISSEVEVLVIDDGSSDGTDELAERYGGMCPLSIRHYSQDKKGPASARNLGVLNAQGQVLLFIGDDIIAARPDFLEQHLRWHKNQYQAEEFAVLGYTTWDPELEVTPYMRWLENGGPQFCYHLFEHDTLTSYRHFYTSNVSLKKSFLANDRFDERFGHAAYEDTELAYRLHKRGLRLVFNKQASAHHHHTITVDKYCERAVLAGGAAGLLGEIHPELIEGTRRPVWKQVIRTMAVNSTTIRAWHALARLVERRYGMDRVFWELYRYYFRKGFRTSRPGVKQSVLALGEPL